MLSPLIIMTQLNYKTLTVKVQMSYHYSIQYDSIFVYFLIVKSLALLQTARAKIFSNYSYYLRCFLQNFCYIIFHCLFLTLSPLRIHSQHSEKFTITVSLIFNEFQFELHFHWKNRKKKFNCQCFEISDVFRGNVPIYLT